jgi:two-component system, sensor histidine kinase and response regulator
MPEAPPARILIVDDEASQMKALCDTLGHAGYETAGFTNGREALAAMQETKFDLLLTDLMMPDLDGIELLRAAQEKDPELVGVLMTGHGTIATAVEAMKAGALDYLLKPFNLRIARPVLERALAMRRLRIENARLQQDLQKRTADLEASNQELEAFAHTISHDLQTPLRGISGYSHILLEDYGAHLPENAKTFLHSISSSAHDMGQLIGDLLSFSCLSRQPLEARVVNVLQLVEDVLRSLRQEHEGRHVEVRIGQLPDCSGDPSLLKQVWVNLLSNAFKFTRRRPQAIIEIGSQRQGHENVYFVQDNGAGFDMRYADKLFGVFRRLHRADEFEGTGIGLSIVQRIIRRHGGRIWAEAKVDKGATFYFCLPSAP